MPEFQWVAFAGLFVAVIIMLLVTQAKEAVAWPAWLVPVLVVVPFVAWTALAFVEEGPPHSGPPTPDRCGECRSGTTGC